MNKKDHSTELKFTKDISEVIDSHVVFLYIDGKESRGSYSFKMGKKFEQYIEVNFKGYPENNENDFSDSLYMRLKYRKKKLTVVSSSYENDLDTPESSLALNQIFIKRTWWHIWGKKAIILLVLIFGMWLLKDVPKALKDKGIKVDLKEIIKENLHKSMDFIKKNHYIFEKNVADAEMTNCVNCGESIKKSSKFCKFCGSKQEDNV